MVWRRRALWKRKSLGDWQACASFLRQPTQGRACTIMAAPSRQSEGRLLVFDVRWRTVRMIRTGGADREVTLAWDGRDSHGRPVGSGVYFMRYESGEVKAAGKVVIVD
jgi:hypothetical protein